MGNARYGESLLKCPAIDAEIVYGYKGKKLQIFNWKNPIITIKINGKFYLFGLKCTKNGKKFTNHAALHSLVYSFHFKA